MVNYSTNVNWKNNYSTTQYQSILKKTTTDKVGKCCNIYYIKTMFYLDAQIPTIWRLSFTKKSP